MSDSDGLARDVHEQVVQEFAATFSFSDARVPVWRALKSCMDRLSERDNEVRAKMAERVVELVNLLGVPDKKGGERFFGQEEDSRGRKQARKAFSGLWAVIMASPLSVSLYKSILAQFAETVLPHLSHPVMAVDFCFAAYRKGGYCALLSLRSLFVISTTLNIDVPDFYPKLYALLTPEIFVAKHRAQLFQLTDLFLSSEYLPLSVAASFSKRLARLALVAPAAGALVCLQLIFNLMRRNPNLLDMVHRPDAVPVVKRRWHRAVAVDRRDLKSKKRQREGDDDEDELADDYVPDFERAPRDPEIPDAEPPLLPLEEEPEDARTLQQFRRPVPAAPVSGEGDAADPTAAAAAVSGHVDEPFDDKEEDPAITGASESSLWELELLQKHYWKPVADAALIFAGNMERPLHEVERASEMGTLSVFEKVRKKKIKAVPLEHRAKASLLSEELHDAFF